MVHRQRETVTGQIIAVQEQRFRLMTSAGRNFLLTLSHSADLTYADLCRFQQSLSPVQVQYSGEPNLLSGVAHSVKPLGNATAAGR